MYYNFLYKQKSNKAVKRGRRFKLNGYSFDLKFKYYIIVKFIRFFSFYYSVDSMCVPHIIGACNYVFRVIIVSSFC